MSPYGKAADHLTLLVTTIMYRRNGWVERLEPENVQGIAVAIGKRTAGIIVGNGNRIGTCGEICKAGSSIAGCLYCLG